MKYEAPTVPCEQSEKHAHSASPPVQVINEKRMSVMVRFKAITKCSAFENRARYSETCTPEQSTHKWILGQELSHYHMLRAVSESFVLLASWSGNENEPRASVCFCTSKLQDTAPEKVNNVYNMYLW